MPFPGWGSQLWRKPAGVCPCHHSWLNTLVGRVDAFWRILKLPEEMSSCAFALLDGNNLWLWCRRPWHGLFPKFLAFYRKILELWRKKTHEFCLSSKTQTFFDHKYHDFKRFKVWASWEGRKSEWPILTDTISDEWGGIVFSFQDFFVKSSFFPENMSCKSF